MDSSQGHKVIDKSVSEALFRAMEDLKAVIDGESGVLVAPGDAGALAGALERLIADPALRERLGAGARARVEAFSAPAVVPRYEAAYERARETRRAGLASAAAPRP